MALTDKEKALLEAISTMLKQDAKLGLPISSETSHTSQFRWEGIDDAFALKVSKSPFAESISSAFFAVHSHKYIDNPTFKLSFDREMSARAVPTPEKERAFKYLEEMTKELSGTKLSEHDAGWNPNIADIADMTRNADNRDSEQSKPFTGGGPAPDGERGGKGGIYMEGFEDEIKHDGWTITYKVTPADDSMKLTLVEAKNESESVVDQEEILKKLDMAEEEFWKLIANGN